ncbi:MAG: sodium:proton antiporter [Bacteroidia bacterium]
MTLTIIITICLLLLLAYVFDISSRLTKIPSVILLLLLGWIVRQISYFFFLKIPDLNPLLPILGTIGLVLIVLEGSLELELNKSKIPIIRKALLTSVLAMFAQAFLLASVFQYLSGTPFKTALLNAIPFCVISSAIAIPSVRTLHSNEKEFIIYESSLSDIFGVLFFNFIALNEVISAYSFGHFGLEFLVIILISFISVLGLSYLLSRIRHHVTFTPIILLVILIYSVSKLYHLPGLIFILVFGLFLGNLEELKGFRWIEKFRPEKLEREVIKFKDITVEITFMIRAIFFMLFGFLMDAHEILNPETLPLSAGIVISILFIRWVILKALKLPVSPLLYVAPRGLITILLFLAILPEQTFELVNKSLIIQTIVLSVLVMMVGLMPGVKSKKKKGNQPLHSENIF